MRKTLFADSSRVEPTICLMEKLSFSFKLFVAILMGNPSLRLSEVLSKTACRGRAGLNHLI